MTNPMASKPDGDRTVNGVQNAVQNAKKTPLNANSEAFDQRARSLVWRLGRAQRQGNISMNEHQNQFALEVLNANKQRFTEKEFRTLKRIAEIGQFDYRKTYEAAADLLPYLPSFRQAVADRLAAIGLEIRSIPANDGTPRKLYSLVQLKTGEAVTAADQRIAATKKTLSGFGFGVYEVAE